MKSVSLKKLAYFLLSLGFVFSLSGCANKASQEQIQLQNQYKTRIVFQNEEIENWLILEDLIYKKREDGLIQIEAKFINKNSFDDQVVYRVDWQDKDGFNINSLLSKWKEVEVYGNANLIIQAISPSIKAEDFSIKLRNPKYEETTISDTQIQ